MAKKKPEVSIPDECCGVCFYSQNDEGDLVCYVNPVQLVTTEDGMIVSFRGGVVETTDPICHLFKPRMHS